jgi:hypothetical protein
MVTFSIRAPGLAPDNKAYFTNCSVKNLACSFNKFIRPNRQHSNVAVIKKVLCMSSLAGLIEVSVSVNSIITILENGVPQNILRVGMTMLPNERNPHLVLMLESARHDSSTVRALESSFGSVTAEIWFHFDVFLSKELDP